MKNFVFILMVIISCFCIGLAAGFYVRAEYCIEKEQKERDVIKEIGNYVGSQDEEIIIREIKEKWKVK